MFNLCDYRNGDDNFRNGNGEKEDRDFSGGMNMTFLEVYAEF